MYSLELMVSSSTWPSTIITQVWLRRFNWLFLFLLYIWAVSPVGTYSSPLVLSTVGNTLVSQNKVTYISTLKSPPINDRNGTYLIPYYDFYVNNLLTASLLTSQSIIYSALDGFDHVKNPDISRLTPTMATTNGTGWMKIHSL